MNTHVILRITFACIISVLVQPGVAEQYDVNYNCNKQWKLNDDHDSDGLSDSFENCLANKHSPVLYLPTRMTLPGIYPASVDWYLSRVMMRFNHDNWCRDDHIIDTPTQSELIRQSNKTKHGWNVPPWKICDYTDRVIYSDILREPHWDDDHHFFLQAVIDDAVVHLGSLDPLNDWKVYIHSYPTNKGVDIEYWYFFPYNDNKWLFNHEGDWENIIIQIDCNLDVYNIIYYQHGEPDPVSKNNVEWLDNVAGSHPLVWIADGSHASYPHDDDECNFNVLEGFDFSCQTVAEERWFTWSSGKGHRPGYQGSGLVQVGETYSPLNGQLWIRYAGIWGEVGTWPRDWGTSGPDTPSMKDSWGMKADNYTCEIPEFRPYLIIDPALMSVY